MKTLFLYAGLALSILAASCNKTQTDHPQSGIRSSAEIDEMAIKEYADSVNNLLPELQKQESLVYTLGDYSFYVEKYMMNAKPVLYIEHGDSGEFGNTEQRYYLKNGEPVLYASSTESEQTGSGFIAERAFFRNEILFNAENKSAATTDEFENASYTQSENVAVNFKEDLNKLENAIDQCGEFDLVFKGITEYPKARYLIFSGNGVNAYRAPVLIENEDDFMREILANPDEFRGRKMLINWKQVNVNEVEYISGSLR